MAVGKQEALVAVGIGGGCRWWWISWCLPVCSESWQTELDGANREGEGRGGRAGVGEGGRGGVGEGERVRAHVRESDLGDARKAERGMEESNPEP